MRRPTRRGVALVGAVLVAACAGPVVRLQRNDVVPGALALVAVAPFHPAPDFRGSPEPGSPSAEEAAQLVARFVSEGFQQQGIEVVAPSDVELAFEGRGEAVPREPTALAPRLAEQLGATSVLLGTVHRFRERLGEPLGAQRPASVGFELALYAAPSGQRLWTARFDETQQALSENVLHARRYPGGGTRWLSAAELARWGAAQTIEQLREQQ